MDPQDNRTRIGDQVVRVPRQAATTPVDMSVAPRTISVRGLTSPMSLIYGFFIIDLIGTSLLMLPISSKAPGAANILTCLFTATTSVTVTGLVTVDTLEHWTLFGQAVILTLIFIGGLGFMTGAAFLIILVGQELRLQNRLIVREGLGWGQLGDITKLVRNIVVFAVAIQLIGFIVLWIYWTFVRNLWEGFDLWHTVWLALFHGISGFNNAGIEVLPNDVVGGDSLQGFSSDYFTLLVCVVLIFVGSTGYILWSDVWRKRSFRMLRLESKLILIGLAGLLLIGFATYAIGEWNNPATSGGHSVVQKISDALFHTVSGRTAGFSVIDYGQATSATDLATEVMMFIGGVSGTVAGGIKINTFMVILIAAIVTMSGRNNTYVFGSRIRPSTVQRALVLSVASATIVVLMAYLAFQLQSDLPFRDVFFQVISAAGTVGLDTGITSKLNGPTQALIIFAMFLGRFGPLTLALLMAGRQVEQRYALPAEEVRIG
ncbi:MAG: hypothetical protein F4Y88_04565 [Chloroflexi bacterium]|nr:hypothetical protein [Chloroflexota bacterium]